MSIDTEATTEQNNLSSLPTEAVISRLLNSYVFSQTEQNQSLTEKNSQNEHIQFLLQPITELSRMEMLFPGHIDIMPPDSQFLKLEKQLSKFPTNKFTIDNNQIFLTPSGPIGLGKYTNKDSKKYLGLRFHFYVPSECFYYAVNSTSEFYSSFSENNSLQYSKFENPRKEECVHTFLNNKYQYNIILHEMSKFEAYSPDVKKTRKSHIGGVKTTNIDANSQENEIFDIQDFPLAKNDPKDRQRALEAFVRISTLLLDIDNYDIKFNKQEIYGNSNQKSLATRHLASFDFSFFGKEHYPGIDIFIGLLYARLKYPFDITSLDAYCHPGNISELSKRYKNFNLKKISTGDEYPKIFRLENKNKLTVHQKARDLEYGKGKKIWSISVGKKHFSNVMASILEISGAELYESNDYSFSIKVVDLRGYTFYVNAKAY